MASEAALLEVARLLTYADMSAKVGTGMLLKDRARVLSAARERGFDPASKAELLQVAASLVCSLAVSKVGSTMMADDPGRVRARRPPLGSTGATQVSCATSPRAYSLRKMLQKGTSINLKIR